MIIDLLGVYQFTPGLATFTLFLGHRYVESQIGEKKIVSSVLKQCVVATHTKIKKIKNQEHYALCDWCVFKSHNQHIYFAPVLHLNVSPLFLGGGVGGARERESEGEGDGEEG